MSKRVFVAGIFHETHTFVSLRTHLADFRVREGQAIWESRGDASVMAGALQVADERGWEVLPILDMDATPSAMVTDEVLALFWERFEKAVARENGKPVDGVCLVMHGAMVTESCLDVEGEILRRIRSLPTLESVPICVALDLHGNCSPDMVQYSSGLVAYRENPHTDAKETGIRAALLLDHFMGTGERPVTLLETPPVVLSPSGTGTRDEPMRSLEAKAREIEARFPEILVVNVFAGFSFADTPSTGVRFSAITTGAPEIARRELQAMSELLWRLKEQGNRIGMPLEEAIDRVLEHKSGPILIVEPAENIGAGAPGDSTLVLEAFVRRNVPNAVVVLHDPESVQALWDLPLGERRELLIGGKSGLIGSEPLLLEVERLSQSTGRFTLEDLHSHAAATGANIEMGRCVVAKHKSTRILLTSRRTPPLDLGQLRSQGIVPEECFAIGVKAAVAYRQAYNPIAKATYRVDTPGVCSDNLHRFPFKQLPRPIYPLDDF
jgi:microcystin degradation protein MlrC